MCQNKSIHVNGVPRPKLRADGLVYWFIVYEDRRKDRPADRHALRKRNERAVAKKISQDNHDELIESAFLPKRLVAQFKERILIKCFADGEKQARYRFLTHWTFEQKLMASIKIDPHFE